MKRLILGLVVLTVFLVGTLLLIGINRKMKNQKEISERTSKLPSFTFMTLSELPFNSLDINEGPVLIVHFHPECEHCQYEISEILKSVIPESFKTVLLVSSANPDSIRRFLFRMNISDFPSVITLADTSYSFEATFGSSPIPTSYIYNSKLKMIKVLHGEVKTETILKYLWDSEHDSKD